MKTVDTSRLFVKAMAHAAAYRRSLAEEPLPPSVSYRDMVERFAEPLPETGMDPGEVIDSLATLAAPGLFPIAAPRFFG